MNAINTSAHSLNKKSKVSVDVLCTTLDDIFFENNVECCDLLKMDCEGAEYEIILSASMETLKKISQIIMEYHAPECFGLDDRNLLNDFSGSQGITAQFSMSLTICGELFKLL